MSTHTEKRIQRASTILCQTEYDMQLCQLFLLTKSDFISATNIYIFCQKCKKSYIIFLSAGRVNVYSIIIIMYSLRENDIFLQFCMHFDTHTIQDYILVMVSSHCQSFVDNIVIAANIYFPSHLNLSSMHMLSHSRIVTFSCLFCWTNH